MAYPDEHGATVDNVYSDVAPYLPESSISGTKAQGDWIFDFSCGTESDYCVGVECGKNQRCVDGLLNFTCVQCEPGFTGCEDGQS